MFPITVSWLVQKAKNKSINTPKFSHILCTATRLSLKRTKSTKGWISYWFFYIARINIWLFDEFGLRSSLSNTTVYVIKSSSVWSWDFNCFQNIHRCKVWTPILKIDWKTTDFFMMIYFQSAKIIEIPIRVLKNILYTTENVCRKNVKKEWIHINTHNDCLFLSIYNLQYLQYVNWANQKARWSKICIALTFHTKFLSTVSTCTR